MFGLVLFFALGFGAGVSWATKRLVPDRTPDDEVAPGPHGAFWGDLNEDLKDPTFRRSYDETTRQIQEYDARMNGEDPS